MTTSPPLSEMKLVQIDNVDVPPFLYLQQFYEYEFSPITKSDTDEMGLYDYKKLQDSWHHNYDAYLFYLGELPVGVLIFEAIIFTIASSIFLLFSQVTDTFWLLLDLASQITLVYYSILFLSAIRLRYLPVLAKGFIIPGGNIALWIIMSLGIFTSLLSLSIGFVAPSNLTPEKVHLFHVVMSCGLIVTLCMPFLFFISKK